MRDTPDYPRYAQRRQLQRGYRRPARAAWHRQRRFPRPYDTQRQAGRPDAAGAGAAPASTTPAHQPDANAPERIGLPFLNAEFARLRKQQAAVKPASEPRAQQITRGRRLPGPRTRRGQIAVAIPLVIFVAAAAILGPIIYRGTRAYQEVFVESPPRQQPRFVAVKNDAGTPVIAEVTATAAPELPEWDGTERITILLLGVDRREDEPSRSDTMILVNIDPVKKTAAMLAIPRDLKVLIPGYGMDKINAAYAFGDRDEVPGGGPGLAIRTIEANFGIRIDYFAEVDFNGFIKIIDTVGGVMIDVPYPIKDDAYPADGTNYMRVYFSAGWQHMDGKRALQYARTRHDDGDGRRSVRQQQVLLALREQALSLDLLPKAGELIAELGDAVRTDLSPTQALKLARLASEIQQNGIAQYSLDRALTEEQLPDEPYYLIADWDIVGQILSDFTGQPVTPPMSALAHPNYALSITVDNGTTNPGLGQRVASVLHTNGFTNVTATDRSSEVEHTRITAPPEELSTAYLVAGLLGIDINAVEIARGGTQAGLQIVLGSDAHDPAYFTSESFDEPADPGSGSSTGTGASSEGISDSSPAQPETVPDDGSGATLGSDTGEGGGVSLGGDTGSDATIEEEEPTIAPSE